MSERPLSSAQIPGSAKSDSLVSDLSHRQALRSMIIHFPLKLLLDSPRIRSLLSQYLKSDLGVQKLFASAVDEQIDSLLDDGLDSNYLQQYDDRREFKSESSSTERIILKPLCHKIYAYANDILVEGPLDDSKMLVITTIPTHPADNPVVVTHKLEYQIATVALSSAQDLIAVAELRVLEDSGELRVHLLSIRDMTRKPDGAAKGVFSIPLVGRKFARRAQVEVRVVGNRILASCVTKKTFNLTICDWITGQILVNMPFMYDPGRTLVVDLLLPNIVMMVSDGSDDIDNRVSNADNIDDMSVPTEYCIKLYSTEQHMTRLLCLQLPMVSHEDENGHTIKLISGSNISPLAPGKPFAWTAPPRISAIHIVPGVMERRSQSPTIILPHCKLLEIAKRSKAIDNDDKPLSPCLDPVPWEAWGPDGTRIVSCLQPSQQRGVLASEVSVGGVHEPFYLLNDRNPAAIRFLAFELHKDDEPTLEVPEQLRTVVDSKWYQPEHPWTLTPKPSRYRSPCFQSESIETRLPCYRKNFTLLGSSGRTTQSDTEED